jgi:hypothetical protein
VKTILSLFDCTGNWSRPYKEAGYHVIQQDIQLGQDIFEHTLVGANLDRVEGKTVHGILAAVPCTDFASSGSRWWKGKENQPAPYEGTEVPVDNRLDFFVGMTLATLAIVEWLDPVLWVIENPRGRIRKLVPEIGPARLVFHPWQYGDPYTKETFLYGSFNARLPQTPALPLLGSKKQSCPRSKRTRVAKPL